MATDSQGLPAIFISLCAPNTSPYIDGGLSSASVIIHRAETLLELANGYRGGIQCPVER